MRSKHKALWQRTDDCRNSAITAQYHRGTAFCVYLAVLEHGGWWSVVCLDLH